MLWCVHTVPASLSTSLLWARALTRSARVNRYATLERGAALISSYADMLQIPAFGVTMLLMLPAPLSLPVLCVNFSVELLVCGLMLVFQLMQVFATSSGCGYRVLVAS